MRWQTSFHKHGWDGLGKHEATRLASGGGATMETFTSDCSDGKCVSGVGGQQQYAAQLLAQFGEFHTKSPS